MNLVAKPSPIHKRLRELEREISKVDTNIRNLSGVVERFGGAPLKLPPIVDPSVEEPAPPEREPVPGRARAAAPRPPRDGRFLDYLSSSFDQAALPLRRERSVQRNKAIVMLCLALLLLFWILHHWLLE